MRSYCKPVWPLVRGAQSAVAEFAAISRDPKACILHAAGCILQAAGCRLQGRNDGWPASPPSGVFVGYCSLRT